MTARLAAQFGAKAMRLLDPEAAHRATVAMMASPFAPSFHVHADPMLATRVAGLDFSNPLGLAAGFDKNAEVPNAMLRLGFGFVEVGAATPRPQAGNERPRIFRLIEDEAVINRYGFNNDGLEKIAARLRRRRRIGIVGVNLGANKDSDDRIEDFVTGVKGLEGLVDFYTVNISSPNTPGLRALQDKAALIGLLSRVVKARDALAVKAPIFLKVAPDLADADKADIAGAALEQKIDALIISNTTIARPEWLKSANAPEKGGLSGKPLFLPSTELLAEFHSTLKRKIPLIGVGGVSSAEDALAKIRAGASLVQLYTALIYQGPGLIPTIIERLPALLKAEGFSSLGEAVGSGV
ncbi:MAG TPA: quinone-dependent dihydroorotate dehydrogenase [Parvularculaceae bacterium]|nr:quinone-dependent dihydroorotate dehydrogenase [Parvularculaceae bacterium]